MTEEHKVSVHYLLRAAAGTGAVWLWGIEGNVYFGYIWIMCYVLTKEENLAKEIAALKDAGYQIREQR